MASMGSFSQAVPPERGAFPLDLTHACAPQAEAYRACLKTHRNQLQPCRALARAFLQCRMDHGLMLRDDMRNLGFGDLDNGTKDAANAKPAASTSSKPAS